MKKAVGLAVLAAYLALSNGPASAYTALFAFGDSLSDAGNLAILAETDHAISPPPSPPYYPGHFSNGPTWVEDLSLKLGLGTLTPSLAGGNDFAFGGAETGPTNIDPGEPIDFLAQVQAYLGAHPSPAPGALYTLDIGANDIIDGLQDLSEGKAVDVSTLIEDAVKNTLEGVTELYDDGARNLLFYTVPELSLTPLFNQDPPATKQLADGLALDFNEGVLAGLGLLEGEGMDVHVLNTYALLANIVASPVAYSFSDVTDECVLTSNCVGGTLAEQNEYLFWDELHPTAAGHMLTADFAYATLTATPEPSTWAMMLIGFAGLGLAGWRARRSGARSAQA
jgi:phospholipase/lecithinase/hemolysin